MGHLVLAAVAASVITFILTPVFRNRSRRAGILDNPNERSSHTVPTPRSGGKAMVVGLVTAAAILSLLLPRSALVPLFAATPFIIMAGLLDDLHGMREWQKFILQVAAASVYILLSGDTLTTLSLGGATIAFGLIALPVTTFWLIGFTNAFNFMDGINGIASLHAIVAGAVFALIAVRHGDVITAAIGVSVLSVAAGFLPWNFPRASVFMGDTGSATLGFLIAVAALRLAPHGFLAAMLPLVPFVFDTTLTLGLRIVRREAWFRAHRTHLYQRLTDLGWSHARVSVLWTFLAALGGAAAVLWPRLSPNIGQPLVVALLVALHVAVALRVLSRRM